MAIVVINSGDIKQLTKFDIKCKNCGSDDIEIEIDWASYPSMSWDIAKLICKICHEEEKIKEYYG